MLFLPVGIINTDSLQKALCTVGRGGFAYGSAQTDDMDIP